MSVPADPHCDQTLEVLSGAVRQLQTVAGEAIARMEAMETAITFVLRNPEADEEITSRYIAGFRAKALQSGGKLEPQKIEAFCAHVEALILRFRGPQKE